MKFARYASALLATIILTLPLTAVAQENTDLPPEEQAKQHFNSALEYSKDPSKETEMIAEYKLCLKMDDSYVDAYVNLGAFYFGKQNYAEAEKNFKKAVELSPSDTAVYDNLGKTYKQLRKYSDAEKTFLAGIAANQSYVSGYRQLGDIYYKLKKYAEAGDALEKYNAAVTDDHVAHYQLGKTYLKLKQPQKALAEFKKTVQMAPDYVNAHNAMGKLYLSQEKYSSAISSYRRSVKYNPKGYRAQYNLAIAVQSNDPENYDEALAAWRQAYKVCKNVPKAKDLAASAKSQIAELEKAKKESKLGG